MSLNSNFPFPFINPQLFERQETSEGGNEVEEMIGENNIFQ